MQTCVVVPYSAAVASNLLRTYLQALHPDAQHSNWRVSMLSGRYCAAYLVYNDMLGLRCLSETASYITPRPPSSENGSFFSLAQRHVHMYM